MRAYELFEGDYNDDLRSEIINLLTAVSAEGIEEVDTKNLLNDLSQQGFAVDNQSLLGILNGLDIVATASADTIQISTSDTDALVGAEADEIEADRVDNLATDQATKDIDKDL